MKTSRRLFVTLFIIVGGLLVSGPMLLLLYGALGAALSGLLVLLAGALLPLPIMLLLKKMKLLPDTSDTELQSELSTKSRDRNHMR